jgi:hypothetical protein
MSPSHIATLRQFIQDATGKYPGYVAKDDSSYGDYQRWHSRVRAYLQVTESADIVGLFDAQSSRPGEARSSRPNIKA